ncbi:MAG: hypothetical protein ACRBDI_03080 [Alphaproteobacteria bacterium]
MSTDKSGSPPCGIYVRIDDFSNMLDLIGYIRQMAFTINQRSGYEKNMSIIEVAFTPENAERAKDIIPIIKDQGLVAIVHGSLDSMGADGILLDNAADIKKTRAALGDDAIIGLVTSDPVPDIDYAVVKADPAVIGKWKAMSDALCVARGKKPITADTCAASVTAGADFVDVSDYILKHKKGIMQGTVNILHEIDQAIKPPEIVN